MKNYLQSAWRKSIENIIIDDKKYLLLPVIFLFSFTNCLIAKTVKQNFRKHSRLVKYDTLEGYFYYENLVKGYVDFDAVVKTSGFIRVTADVKKSYEEGYYIIMNPELFRYGIKFHYDSLSIGNFLTNQWLGSVQDGSLLGTTSINPYCGIYFKKYYLKIEVINLGKIRQRVPRFKTCDELKQKKKHRKKYYRLRRLNTFLITNMLDCRTE